MKEEGKPSINAEIEVADGKVATLQADPECREVNRMVADLNRRVVRVQTHGLASWERRAEKGRPRGFGVEVAHEAAEEAAPASASAFYGGADEQQRQPGANPVVEQYLDNLQRIEGKPGPLKRTLRRWLYGKRAPQATAKPGEGCYCRQVEVVAGKVSIAEASGMQDEAVDRLLVDVYFHSPPEKGIGKVFRGASRMTRRFSERVKTAVGRIGHRSTEPRVEEGAQATEEAGAQVAADPEVLQPRQSRPVVVVSGPQDSEDHERDRGSMWDVVKQRKDELQQGEQATEEAGAQVAADPEALQLRQSRPVVVLSGPQDLEEHEQDRGSMWDVVKQRKDELKQGEQATEEAGAQVAADPEVLQLRQSRPVVVASGPQDSEEHERDRGSLWDVVKQRKDELIQGEQTGQARVSSRKETQFYDAESGPAPGEGSDSPGEPQGELRFGHDVGIYQVRLESGSRNANESNANKLPQPLSLTPQLENAKAKGTLEILQEDKRLTEDGETGGLRDQSNLAECDHHRTVVESDWQIKEVRKNLEEALFHSEQSTTSFERSNVCGLAPPAGGKPRLPDRESLNGEDSRTSAAQLAGERPEQWLGESEQTRARRPKDQRRTLEVFIMRGSSVFELQTPDPECELSEEVTLASHQIGELEFEEGAEDNKSSSAHPHGENTPSDERPLQDNNVCRQTGCSGPSCSNARAGEERGRSEEAENTQSVVRPTKEGRKTI